MRIRTIKPEFWKHDLLSELPESTHMLAAALLNYADDEGYFNANPSLIKAECFPLREPSVSVPESLRSLQSIGFLDFGTGSDGRRYGRVAKFSEHQRVSHPTPSKIKGFGIVWTDSGNSPEDSGSLREDSAPERKGREQGTGNREVEEEQGSGKESLVASSDDGGGDPPEPKKHKPDSLADKASRVLAHYRTHHPKAYKSGELAETSNIWKLLKARWVEGCTVEDICKAIDGLHLSSHHTGQNDSGAVYLGLEYAIRTPDAVTKFIELAENPPKSITAKTSRTLTAMERFSQGAKT